MSQYWTRNHQAADLLEPFLVSSIASLLIVRFLLHLTGYPQLGGETLHIAHMLWGGLCMLIALGVAFTFLGHSAQKISAIVGGIGFGIFIDELGKFITQDNNYFYKPTIAILYIVFIGLFFIVRFIQQHQNLTAQENLLNALHQFEDIDHRHLDALEAAEIQHFLNHAPQQHPLTQALQQALPQLTTTTSTEDNTFTLLSQRLQSFVARLLNDTWFNRGITIYFLAQAVGLLLATFAYTFYGAHIFVTETKAFTNLLNNVSVVNWAEFLSSAASSLLVVSGAIVMPHSRVQALTFFKYSELVAIFITQVFAFYQEQLSAIFALALHICLLLILNYLIAAEKRHQTVN